MWQWQSLAVNRHLCTKRILWAFCGFEVSIKWRDCRVILRIQALIPTAWQIWPYTPAGKLSPTPIPHVKIGDRQFKLTHDQQGNWLGVGNSIHGIVSPQFKELELFYVVWNIYIGACQPYEGHSLTSACQKTGEDHPVSIGLTCDQHDDPWAFWWF